MPVLSKFITHQLISIKVRNKLSSAGKNPTIILINLSFYFNADRTSELSFKEGEKSFSFLANGVPRWLLPLKNPYGGWLGRLLTVLAFKARLGSPLMK
jgi:hypothetical protein